MQKTLIWKPVGNVLNVKCAELGTGETTHIIKELGGPGSNRSEKRRVFSKRNMWVSDNFSCILYLLCMLNRL